MQQHQTHTALTCPYKDQGKPSQQKEYFVYDAIDRLSQVELNDEISQQISYDQSGLGNITRKTGVTTTEDMVGTYGQGFLSGAAGSFIGGGTGTLLQNADAGLQAFGTVASGSIAGGVGAEIMGGNFWEGAMYGAISSGLNHAYHNF